MSLNALFAAATGMEAQQTRIGNIANNLANLNTIGFKASRESFEDMMYEQVQAPGTNNSTNTVSPTGIQIGHGTRLVGIYKHFTQGESVQTNRELDVAIQGNGFLKVTMDNGEAAYTRDGGLRINAEGTIVNANGLALEPALTIPPEAKSVTIGQDGIISVIVEGDAAAQEIGSLELVLFQNPSGLMAIGQNLFKESEASGAATTATPGEAGAGTFGQGFLENSNVNVSEELINMIVAQRAYEANSRVLSSTNEMMQAANNSV